MFLAWKLYFTASFVSTSPLSFTWSNIFLLLLLIVFGRLGSPIKSLLLLTVVRQRWVGGSGLTLPTTPLFTIEPSPAQDGTDKKRRWQDEVHQSLGWWVNSHIYMILLLFYSKKKMFQWSVRKRWTRPPQTNFAAWLLCKEAKGFCDFSKGIEDYMRRCHGSHSCPLIAGKLL